MKCENSCYLVMKGNGYLCYNSFQVMWYFGPLHLSEIWCCPTTADSMAAKYAGARTVSRRMAE